MKKLREDIVINAKGFLPREIRDLVSGLPKGTRIYTESERLNSFIKEEFPEYLCAKEESIRFVIEQIEVDVITKSMQDMSMYDLAGLSNNMLPLYTLEDGKIVELMSADEVFYTCNPNCRWFIELSTDSSIELL